ncbi:hypothetical protein ACTHOQ_04955 [Solibacillus silvestris]|uniref:hypothetical protein n=1 Tax=Solibacillus silvestris TaxID=76853 RepID=UPI003F7FA47C
MSHQNKRKNLKCKWISTVVLLEDMREIEREEMAATDRFPAAALDILIMKLLEVQKNEFTKDSYETLQNTILKALNTKSGEVAQIFNELLTAAGNLQIKHANEQRQYADKETINESPRQTAASILQKALQAIVFNVNQFPYDQMTDVYVEQVNRSLRSADEAVKEKAEKHELKLAFMSVLASLMNVQLLEKNEMEEQLTTPKNLERVERNS